MDSATHDNQDSPLHNAERNLRPWVLLAIVPSFAFFNSGITLSATTVNSLLRPEPLGIAGGLFFGKQLGVFGATWAAVRFGFVSMPLLVNWRHIYGVAALAGVGFTMRLFIAGLAFTQPVALEAARLSVVIGSLLSAGLGIALLWHPARV